MSGDSFRNILNKLDFIVENNDPLIQKINDLSFGQSTSINLGELFLDEALGQDKGANGRIAEYSCALTLANTLVSNGLRVTSDIGKLKDMADNEVVKYNKSLGADQIRIAIDAGVKMAESMAKSIMNNGKDLVFTEYQFVPKKHSYDIEPTGAAQSKGSTDDLVIHIKEDNTDTVVKKILLSLKVSGGPANSQGSKNPMPLLWKMFVDPQAKTVKASDFVTVFGEKGKEFVEALEDFKNAGREFLQSPEGQNYAKEKEQDRLQRGKSSSSSKVSANGNFFRSKEAGDYFTKTRGHKSEHNLSKLFVELYEHGRKNLNGGDWKKFNEGFKQAIGFDDVITYKAICDKQGVSEIVSSATSQSYQKLYQALENEIDVVLSHRPNSGGIGVTLTYKGQVIDSLSCSIWKDGTIQFKFDSSKE